jgi:glycerol kinase
MKNYIISLDQGTTSSRSIIFDTESNVLNIEQQEFSQIFPKSGWVEHDPMEILVSQKTTLEKVTKKFNLDKDLIKTIGITNQRETVVAWNKNTGIPYYNAIVWQDTRTSNYCKDLIEKNLSEIIQKKTGLILDSYFSASKMNWILENCPNAKEDAENGDLLFGTIDTWLIWNLTDKKSYVTDVSNASRT